MKRTLSLILSLVMLLSITAGLNLTAKAETKTGTCGENVTYSLDSSTGELTISGTGNMDNYNYYDSNNPFYDNSVIKTITISSGVTSVGDFAFQSCTNLTSVTIGNSVTSIGDRAFEGCTSLASISVDENNKNYSSADGVLFDKGKTTLIRYPQASAITKYTIPNSVTSIGDFAFQSCTNLTSVTIPNSVTSIIGYAFDDCTSLTSINVDKNNGDYSSTDGILFNKDKTTLIRYPQASAITEYTIPNSVTSIGENAFSWCESLTSVTIPDSVRSIGYHAFVGCESLTSVTIGNSVTSIENSAFQGCESLTSVTIPDSVTSIGWGAFNGCTSLTSINVDKNNEYYSSDNGILFDKGKTTLIKCPPASTIKTYSIPNSVTSIGDDAFSGCTSLASITIPNSVTSIEQWAFQGCTNLTSVTIPDSVTSIGVTAFANCTSLTSVIIPNSVTSIGDSAFADCTSLKDLYYLGTKAEWNNINIEDDNDCLTNATLHCTDDVKPQPTPNPAPQPIPQQTPQPSVPTTQAQQTTQPQQTTQAQSNSAQKPKSTKTKKVKSSKKAIAVEWVKTKGVKGYEIQVATDKKFKKNKKTVTVKKQKTTKTTVKKLKAKKKYYVRVRTYKIVNGKKVYSSWSKVKSVKTK